MLAPGKDIQTYIATMEEIKRRIQLIDLFLVGDLSTGYLITGVEFICLQFEEFLELLALSSLTSHRDKYERVRDIIACECNAKKILKAVERENPAFYPIPIGKQADADTESYPRKTDGFLTRNDFVHIYNDCAEVIRVTNPFSDGVSRSAELLAIFPEWLYLIVALLETHEITLADGKKKWLVMMSGADDGRVGLMERRKKNSKQRTVKISEQ